ncbi:male sterility protein [Corynespora cassiicola Philippines]|uniref:gluconokinase n=1 Tax=Corynespora cassiicola Philippines TaxID=1448308 RepID=A0A2T2PCJ0_CORCC|nr:male sterility protein [Corynespora cassiicola Philippines]
MAPAQVAIPAIVSQPSLKVPVTQSITEATEPLDEASICTVDGLVRHRARTNPHAIVVSYPSSGIEFVDYSMQQLDVFAYRVARHYQAFIPTRTSSSIKPTTVALLGPSNLEYAVTMLALTKLGHTVLFLSTRISQLAIESLIETTGATHLLVDPRYVKAGSDALASKPHVKLNEIAGRSIFEFPVEVYADTRMDYQLDPEIEKLNNVYIIHSSGSTGLPKPIYQFQKSAIANYAISMDMKAFITLPLYHNHGICNFFRAIHSCKSIHLYNADLPLTQQYLTNILRKHNFEIFYGVPYALKLLAETEEGIALLKQLKIVMYGGSACPDTLGDLLVENGINLVGHYGATEVGQLMTSFRPAGDKAWNYVRESEKLKPFLKWVPQGPNLYECTVTDGWPSKVQSNRPDGSYATKDLFEPHPTIPGAWKYIARLDDTIVLVNGEKFNPVMMEGKVRSHKAVTETIVFGNSRPYLGILIVPSPAMEGKTEDQIVDHVFPVIEEANHTAEAYARISRDMVKILPHDCQFPRTDKGSIIRQAFYKQFAKEINDAYDLVATSGGELKAFDLPEMEDFVRGALIKSIPEAKDIERTADFFSVGLDSLQSIQMRTEILKNVDIGDNKLGQNVVFEYPSISGLSAYLYGLRTGQTQEATAIEDKMKDLIEKYGEFTPRPTNQSIVVTGATGSLGAHVVAQLTARPDISTVYALVRARNDEEASRRVTKSLIHRKLYHTLPLSSRSKIVAISSNLSDAKLGLSDEAYSRITSSLRSVIHCAWSVNFNIGLSSFEKDCISGVRHLLDLCHAVPSTQPASFDFCSSVSTVSRCPSTEAPERLPELEWAQNMGYAQSKLVAENVCVKAAKATGIRARVLRVGQIVADTMHGVWNATEGIPLQMQTALTVGALPKLQETPSWTPVDVVAKTISEIALSDAGAIIANVTNAKTFDYTNDLLPALRNAGLKFDEVEPKEWVRRLKASNQDPVANPPIKLLDFFASKYDKDTFGPSRTFETATARKFSPALENAPGLDQDFVNKFVSQFLSSAWKQPEEQKARPGKQVIVVAGPCGSGKTTVAEALGKSLSAPFIEGDLLHTFDAVTRMASGTALLDSDRGPWLERLKRRALETIEELGYDKVILSCSALKKVYRDQLRGMRSADVEVVFVDLQVAKEELVRRMQGRAGHYMPADLVDSQIDIYEQPGTEEVDILPVDGGKDMGRVIRDVEQLIQDAADL